MGKRIGQFHFSFSAIFTTAVYAPSFKRCRVRTIVQKVRVRTIVQRTTDVTDHHQPSTICDVIKNFINNFMNIFINNFPNIAQSIARNNSSTHCKTLSKIGKDDCRDQRMSGPHTNFLMSLEHTVNNVRVSQEPKKLD